MLNPARRRGKGLTSSDQTESEAEAETAPAQETTAATSQKRRRRLPRLFRVGIQSKLLVTLLVCSISSVAVIGIIGALTGRNALREVESERLIELRESQKRQVEALFKEVTNSLIVYSDGFSVNEATTAFTAGFAQLANATINPAQQQALVNYYTNRDDQTDQSGNRRRARSQRSFAEFQRAEVPSGLLHRSVQVGRRGDGTSRRRRRQRVVGGQCPLQLLPPQCRHLFDYPDALLLDMQGNVVYSVNKGPDLGTNILTGPYRESNLRDAYQKALRSNDVDFVWITDFQPYQPQLDAPTAWVVSPVGMNGKIEGVMALPLPISKINRIMTANKHWQAAGMGASTETYLAGPDNLMRSDSRLFLEDPQEYRREAVAAGTPPDIVNEAIRLGGTTLVQPVPSAGLRAAQRGESGTISGHRLHR